MDDDSAVLRRAAEIVEREKRQLMQGPAGLLWLADRLADAAAKAARKRSPQKSNS